MKRKPTKVTKKKRLSKKENKEQTVKMANEIIEQYGNVFKKLANE
jgi:hypothetical protein